jgi:hypothetical protein
VNQPEKPKANAVIILHSSDIQGSTKANPITAKSRTNQKFKDRWYKAVLSLIKEI